jgi:hypothetical protein
VDLESVFPTHGVVGSNPTKPKNAYKQSLPKIEKILIFSIFGTVFFLFVQLENLD